LAVLPGIVAWRLTPGPGDPPGVVLTSARADAFLAGGEAHLGRDTTSRSAGPLSARRLADYPVDLESAAAHRGTFDIVAKNFVQGEIWSYRDRQGGLRAFLYLAPVARRPLPSGQLARNSSPPKRSAKATPSGLEKQNTAKSLS
jgi:hypothetical protein